MGQIIICTFFGFTIEKTKIQYNMTPPDQSQISFKLHFLRISIKAKREEVCSSFSKYLASSENSMIGL